MPFTAKVVMSNPTLGEVHSKQQYVIKFNVSDLDRSVVFSGSSSFFSKSLVHQVASPLDVPGKKLQPMKCNYI